MGDPAFQLIDIEFESEQDADLFAHKLMLIHSYDDKIHKATKSRQEATQSQSRAESNPSSPPPRRVSRAKQRRAAPEGNR